MNLPDTTAFLTWLSQTDHRIQVTDANIQVWSNALATIPTAAVKAAAMEHYRTNETAAPTPAGIRNIALGARERELARQRALAAGPSHDTGVPAQTVTQLTERGIMARIMRDPVLKAKYEEGVREGRATRAFNTIRRETGDRRKAGEVADAIRRGVA